MLKELRFVILGIQLDQETINNISSLQNKYKNQHQYHAPISNLWICLKTVYYRKEPILSTYTCPGEQSVTFVSPQVIR